MSANFPSYRMRQVRTVRLDFPRNSNTYLISQSSNWVLQAGVAGSKSAPPTNKINEFFSESLERPGQNIPKRISKSAQDDTDKVTHRFCQQSQKMCFFHEEGADKPANTR